MVSFMMSAPAPTSVCAPIVIEFRRVALTPMVTLLGLLLPGLLGGALFVEKVFSWPGMGLLATKAIGARDYDLVTATVIVGSIMVVIGNALADLLHVAIDPRVRE